MVAILNQPPPAPLKGWISKFKVNHEGKKFGPYHYRCWKTGQKVHKQYIKPKDLDYYLAACQAYRERKKIRSQKNKEIDNYISNSRYLGVMLDRLEKGPVEQEHVDFIRKIHKEGCNAQGRPLLRPKRRFMDPFFTNLWIECYEKGLAFAPILMAHQLKVPLEEIGVDLHESDDPQIELAQEKAVLRAYMRCGVR